MNRVFDRCLEYLLKLLINLVIVLMKLLLAYYLLYMCKESIKPLAIDFGLVIPNTKANRLLHLNYISQTHPKIAKIQDNPVFSICRIFLTFISPELHMKLLMTKIICFISIRYELS